jgi:hypothetical protein
MEDEDDCSGGLFKSFYVGSCRTNVLEDQRNKIVYFKLDIEKEMNIVGLDLTYFLLIV